MQKCCTCNNTLDFSFFNKSSSTKTGYNYKCRACHKIYRTERKKCPEIVEKIRKNNRDYRKRKASDFDYRLEALLRAAKARAEEKGRAFDIDLLFLKEIYPSDGKCPVFGIELKFGNSGFRENSPSIDRIDSSGGYTKDNVQTISWKANRLKAYATVEDLELLIAFMKQGD